MLLNHRRKQTRDKQGVVELNITAFLALMVILVPFLLLTVVFTPHAVITTPLALASDTPQEQVQKPLIITLRAGDITIQDFAGNTQSLPAIGGQYDLPTLSVAMQSLKARFQAETKARLLLDENVSYADTLEAMQAVAGWRYTINGGVKEYPMFPEISRGLAAPLSAPLPAPLSTLTPTTSPDNPSSDATPTTNANPAGNS